MFVHPPLVLVHSHGPLFSLSASERFNGRQIVLTINIGSSALPEVKVHAGRIILRQHPTPTPHSTNPDRTTPIKKPAHPPDPRQVRDAVSIWRG
ncbi:hypothetical protein BJ508DRAFT_417564 [Ascobolus immersus RN42]|uniref:Uncharacterized protein n=1 Tax=Ascobolus immersus RN42 TaxID=1160509 RepID=A0A3N4HU19_ASCIM|nr:hypothetical protein BJ508DRAFT_417564 [Ascobolus immersus RN42]